MCSCNLSSLYSNGSVALSYNSNLSICKLSKLVFFDKNSPSDELIICKVELNVKKKHKVWENPPHLFWRQQGKRKVREERVIQEKGLLIIQIKYVLQKYRLVEYRKLYLVRRNR